MIKAYYHLTKPGIIYGNAMAAVAAFLLAAHSTSLRAVSSGAEMAANGEVDIKLLAAMLVGLALVIASGCVFNNIADAKIDAQMERTKNRAMAKGSIGKIPALMFGAVLLLLGIITLHYHVNQPALLAAMAGWIVYVLIYTPLKRRTVYATLIGAIAGATPPVVGYAAVTNTYDVTALVLFLILVCWQMPHFYAIGLRRIDDYKNAGIPIWPIKKGARSAKIQILLFIIAFIIAASFLTYFRVTGYVYLAAMLLLGIRWFSLGLQGFKAADDKIWAKKLFLFSLVVLVVLSIMLSLNFVLP